jgi:YidC/Oxa1 family membrane protein insertase
MKKKDLLIVVALFALWMAWPIIDRQVIKKHFFRSPPPAAGPVAPAPADEEPGIRPAPVAPAAPAEAISPAPAMEAEAARPAPEPSVPEQTVVIGNGRLQVTLSSHGAAVKSVELTGYRRDLDPGSGSVVLDFAALPALAYGGLAGLGESDAFEMRPSESRGEARFERALPGGLTLRRSVRLDDGYLLQVQDDFVNAGREGVDLPAHSVRTGPMPDFDIARAQKGMIQLGVDTLTPGGEGVRHWGSQISKRFTQARDEKGLPKLPATVDWSLDRPVDWVAAKNKYFVQIVAPEGEGAVENGAVRAVRQVSPAEAADPEYKPRGAVVQEVSASLQFAGFAIPPGETVARRIRCYIGPKKLAELDRYGLHLVDVMEFGMWAPVGRLLLKLMNGIHDVLWPHNYGIAIILLTILVRIVFWPITHKSTESMKKMQAIQPLVNAVRQRYKDNPQKQQQEIMALYKEHKVNPLGGCLPTLIQIPVFIALFVVLRSAIELRFAPFLWIRDLSQPENLFAGVLPIPLNILPIIMAVTMVWQQKMTPGTGDPAQQKMMMFMPVMMLVLFYNFAAGLVLYWTTNQCLMIMQQLMMHRKKGAALQARGAA